MKRFDMLLTFVGFVVLAIISFSAALLLCRMIVSFMRFVFTPLVF